MDTFGFWAGTEGAHTYFTLLHTREAPDAQTWTQYVEEVADAIRRSATAVHVFAVTDGGGPDPGQRQALSEAFALDRHGAMTHVFTTSQVTRGIVTAFRWVARARALAHRPEAFGSVCKQCNLPVEAVLCDLQRLQLTLPPVDLLGQVERIARPPSQFPLKPGH